MDSINAMSGVMLDRGFQIKDVGFLIGLVIIPVYILAGLGLSNYRYLESNEQNLGNNTEKIVVRRTHPILIIVKRGEV